MLRKMKEQSIMEMLYQKGKLSKASDEAEKMAQSSDSSEKMSIKELSEQQKARNLKGFDAQTSNSHSIISANAGSITDMGGPSKYMKGETSNSIWDTNRLAEEAKKIDNKTATQMEKQKIENVRQEMRQERTDHIVDTLKDIDQRKASGVNSMAEHVGSGYKVPNNQISIFDKSEFERVPEKTAGEIISENVKKRREAKDDSWKGNGKSITSADVTQRMFDNFFTQPEE